MNKETNKQAAEKLFATTNHDVLWANPKGEFFTSENIGALSLKNGQKLEKFERSVKTETVEVDVKPKNAETLIAEAKNIESIELAQLAKDVELKGKNRSTVIAAYDERIEELTADINVDGKIETGTSEGTPGNGNEDTDPKN